MGQSGEDQMNLKAVVTRSDMARVGRLLLAWKAGGKPNADLVLAEADATPGGVAALIFALVGLQLTSWTPYRVAVPSACRMRC